jgi:serine/threonine protein kinase
MYPIGEGRSGSVWLARRSEDGRMVAVKWPKRDSMEAADAIQREFRLVNALAHKNVVKTLNLLFLPEVRIPFMIMEYVRGRSVYDTAVNLDLETHPEVPRRIAAELCDAVLYISAKGIVHRDINPHNVIIVNRSDVTCVLVDFGTACEPQEFAMLSVTGNLDYRPPEMVFNAAYGPSVDVWGVGTVVVVLLAMKPFHEICDVGRIALSFSDTPELSFSGSPWLIDLKKLGEAAAEFIGAACELIPSQRATFAELRTYPFVTFDG